MQKIKLCGMMRECDIEYANDAKPDYVGFVFADSRRRISRKQADLFKGNLSSDIATVGVFVDEDLSVVGSLLRDGIIDIAQLHGNEDIDYISRLKDLYNKPIIKAVKVASSDDIAEAAKLPVEYLLLDTYKKGVLGGTGERFDWDIISGIKQGNGCIMGKPFFLAGGLSMDNISEASMVGSYALDISTGIEIDGYKDRDRMIEIVRRIRNV